MAKIEPKDGKYELGDTEQSELEGIDEKKYDVFTEQTKLEEAREKYKHINWFVSFTIKDKEGNDVHELPEYTIKLDRPEADSFELYYYLNGTAYPFQYEPAEEKNSKKRVKAKLIVGDPPTGHYP